MSTPAEILAEVRKGLNSLTIDCAGAKCLWRLADTLALLDSLEVVEVETSVPYTNGAETLVKAYTVHSPLREGLVPAVLLTTKVAPS